VLAALVDQELTGFRRVCALFNSNHRCFGYFPSEGYTKPCQSSSGTGMETQ
jgi:hypothetical protein